MSPTKEQIREQVASALAEDIGTGDVTASLISESETVRTQLICRESVVACGRDWVDAVLFIQARSCWFQVYPRMLPRP